MSSTQQEFLFFDTIIHDGEIEQVLRVDEIKFDQPVYIDEIRILPPGYNVNNLERSPTRIGATKPMPCELEFFGKNLNARKTRDRVRYRRLGKKMFHDENDMVYYPSLSIPTDSMIVKGKYEVLTLAIVGVLARPKSPPPRHDPPSNNKQIVDFLQSALPSQRAHPMDTLSLPIVPSPSTFPVQQHPNSTSMIENASSSSSSSTSAVHSDGVWVAPPEQQVRQQPQVTPSFSHLQPQRSTSNFPGQSQSRLNDEHMHDYNPSTRTQSRPDYAHTEDIDDKTSRIPPYHIKDELNPPSIPIVTPSYSRLNPQQQLNSMVKKDDDHIFLHPSCMNENNSRRSFDNGSNIQHQISTDADSSYMSDDNTSESETSSIHGLFLSEDEYQAFKRDALYNTRSSTRFTTLKTFHSPIKTVYEIECEKAHHDKYRQANEELILHFRKILSRTSIDHCDLSFLESLETLCTTLPIALACLDSNDELLLAIERLTNWTLKLLHLEYILENQFTDLKETLFKIRLIKCGIRLAGHLSLLNEDLSTNWIKNDIQSKLLDLYDDSLISPSIKSLIIKTLDQTIFFKSGLLWFIGQHPDLSKQTFVSPYFRLIKLLQFGTELKQSNILINCLIRKIHFNEELIFFQNQIKLLSTSEKSCLTSKEIVQLEQTLSTIRHSLITKFDLNSQDYSNQSRILLRFLIENDFVQSLTILIHLTILNHNYELFYLIKDILREFFKSFDILIYLFNQTSIHNHLFKALYFAETKFDSGSTDPIGPQLMCAFQLINHLDELKFLNLNETLSIDNNHLLESLHRLLSLILFHHYIRKLSNKRRILIDILSMDKNFQLLIQLFDCSGDKEIVKNSIRMKYLSKIFYEIFVTPDSICLLEKYGVQLYELCEKFSNPRLNRLKTWFFPLMKIKSIDSNDELAEILFKELQIQLNESINTGEFSPSLVTILRLIEYHSIASDNQLMFELKYDYLLLKFYHLGIYSLLITILQKCADALLRPWQIGLTINLHDRLIIHGIIHSTLIIFKVLIQKLVLDRKSKFIDLTPINALFSIYTVTLCASPSTDLTDIDSLRTNLIDAFLAYTWTNQPINVENCAWTKVIEEILRLTIRYPYSIPCGLCLLTELLPIPLPYTVRQPLNDNEIQTIKDDFHRYSTVMSYIFVHDSNHQFEKFFQSIVHTSNTIMQEILRRLFMQLIDLGPRLAKYLIKLLIDQLISSWKIDKQSINDSGRLITFLASLISIRSGKCALLAILNSSDEKYSNLFENIFEIIHMRPESNEICLCQEAIMSIIQNLCDTNLCLSKFSSENSLQNLANALPTDDFLSLILTHLVRLLSTTKNQPTWTQITMAIRTMISLTEHDYGLEKIQIALMENKDVFGILIADFDLRFDKEQPDYLEAVSTLMIFLQRLILRESSSLRTRSFRQLIEILPNNESQLEKFMDLINAVVNDDSSGTHENEGKSQSNLGGSDGLEQTDDEQQCLQTLQKIFERGNQIIQYLKTNEPIENPSIHRILLPKRQSVDNQFEHRLIYTIVPDYTDDQRSSELYWLGIPPTSLIDDVDYVQDETNEDIKCDLEDLINKYCGTFHFVDQYQKEIVDKLTKKRKSSSKKRTVTVETPSNVDTSIITTSMSKSRTQWTAPMRGNNRRNLRPTHVNTNNGNLQRRIDHFRNRPLNTSRPPSMHVDEFEKQFHNENSNTNNSSTITNNNNNNNDNNNNTTNDNDLLSSTMQSNNETTNEREHWSRRGTTAHFRSSSTSNYRHSFASSNLGYPIGGFSLRDRLPYAYPSSRYPAYDMDYFPSYMPPDELSDDHPYDYYSMNISFDPNRYRGHFSRYDPSGFH